MLTPLLQYGCAAEEAFLFVPLTQDGGTVPYGAGGPGVLGGRLSQQIPQKIFLGTNKSEAFTGKIDAAYGSFLSVFGKCCRFVKQIGQ